MILSKPRTLFSLATPPSPLPSRLCQAGLVLLLLGMAGLLFFGRLGCPLLEPEETRYAEIPREMQAEGHFLIPVLHGQPYYHKPPLLYWLVMGCYALFGVHDWAARLVPGTAGILTVLITYFWGRRTAGHRAGFAGALILCLSARFVYFARMLTCDGLLVLGVVGALAAAHVAVQEPRLRRGWWLLAGILCGLGILTKGPVALVLVLGPVVAFHWFEPRGARVGLAGWLAFLGTALAVAGPWYLLVAARDPHFLPDFFWTHHVLRFLKPIDHHQPFWFYLPGLLLGMLPWTLLLPPFLRYLGRRSDPKAQPRPAALGYFLLAFLVGLVFFSAAGCKRAGYILPALPPLALALGCYLDALLSGEARHLAKLAYGAALLTLVLAVAACPLGILAGICTPAAGLFLAALFTLALGVMGRVGGGRSLLTSGVACAGITFAVLLVGLHQLLPGYTRKFSLRGQVRCHFLLTRDSRLPVACYPHGWDSVRFYLGRSDVLVYSPGDCREMRADLKRRGDMLVFVKADHPGGKPLTDFLAGLPAGYEFVPLGRGGWVTAGMVRPRSNEFAACGLAKHR